MSFDFSTLIWIVILFTVLQPMLMGRLSAMQRMRGIRAIEQAHGSRVITMIHRQSWSSIGRIPVLIATSTSVGSK
jgi:hypothetical protein